ncbi:MAG: histone deacetylase [Planctomycetota bacterium]
MVKLTRRRKVLLAVVIVAPVAVWWFTPPRAMRQVADARDGNVLDRRVAVVFSANYDVSLAGIERFYHFDIHKYANIYRQLVADGLLRPEDVFVPEEAMQEELLLVHTKEYLQDLKDSGKVARYLEFDAVAYMPSEIIDVAFLRAFRYCTGGTILASRLAVKHGIGINLGGGYHHARPDRGSGFCIYADVPIAIRKLQKEGLIKRALLVDLDVHQGDGSAICFAGDDDVFTFSIHDEHNYPIPKARSDLDIGLEGHVDDATYLKVLRDNLPTIIQKAKPDIIYLLAGVDVYAGDRLGHMDLTSKGILERDMLVFDEAVKRKIPIVMVLSGGYCPASWRLQYNTVRKVIETRGRARKTEQDEPKP